MVEIPRIAGLFSIIPATLLLTVIFFVLVVMRKTADKSIKTFGKVVIALLSIAAVLLLSVGVYILTTGTHPLMQCPMMPEMQQKMMPQGMQPQPQPAVHDVKRK